MTIKEVRILPPFAIGRLGAASQPLDNYTIEDNPELPLSFRRILGAETLEVDEKTGEIARKWIPDEIKFKEDGKIRPVAPFLEVFVVTEGGSLELLDIHLLESLRGKIEWRVTVANRKVVRRTENEDNLVHADTGWFSNHEPHVLKGHCKNFVSHEKYIDFGRVRFIKPHSDRNPDRNFPEIRLRFTPATGLIYGPTGPPSKGVPDSVIPPALQVYDHNKDWVGFGKNKDDVKNETVPPSLYAIDPPAPSWLNNNIAVSRGYLDDSCDGFVEVRLTLPGQEFMATARICAGPPALVPDSLFVRSLADDLDQVIFGPKLDKDEPYEVTRDRAIDIIRRAYETVRFMNVAMMNGNNFKGRSSLSLDSMPEEEAADTERAIRPIMSPGSVDTLSILRLHEQVFASLRGGAAPWFLDLLRRPDEVADFTDRGRRKMPALMCGADNNYLALTWRQIDTIRQAAENALFHKKKTEAEHSQKADLESVSMTDARQLQPRNMSAEEFLSSQLHYEAAGNPISSRPVTSVANCCPGLEVDFRAVWRRMFSGIELREYDNFVVIDEKPADRNLGKGGLTNHRLLRVRVPKDQATLDRERRTFLEHEDILARKKVAMTEKEKKAQGDELKALKEERVAVEKDLENVRTDLAHPDKERKILMMTEIKGPASSDPDGWIALTTQANPYGLAALEWSNALALVLSSFQGEEVCCDFTQEEAELQQPLFEEPKQPGDPPKNYVSFMFRVRHFFDDDTAVISKALAYPGELTQGLCSPWQNDYRECSCYYWASARPDYINVEPGPDGLSRGDNWLQKTRTGSYVPDDYSDSRLILYDELFDDWQCWLKFQIGGRDAPGELNNCEKSGK